MGPLGIAAHAGPPCSDAQRIGTTAVERCGPGPTRGLSVLAVNHTGMVSGGEEVVLRMLAAAAEQGWVTTVAAPAGPIVERAADIGAGWLPLPDLGLPGGRLPVATTLLGARNAVAARRIRALAHVDVVVASGMRVLPVLRLAAPRAPVVWLVQSMVDRRRWRRLVRACAPVVGTAVAVSQAVADSIGPARFPVTVVPNGTPWPVEPAPVDPPSPTVLGCAAMLTPWKGQDVLLEAVARLTRKDVVVELMGGCYPKDVGYADRLRHRASAPDLLGRVRFLGHVADPVARMRTWTLAVSSSVDPEAAPLSVLEAMSVGVPIVATNHGGPPEVVGDAGVLVAPRDSEAMAAAVDALLDDSELRLRCARAGPRIVASGFRLDRQIDVLLGEVGKTVGASTR
jgi:glycosyltransferase involved in cell wall biosynthesis